MLTVAATVRISCAGSLPQRETPREWVGGRANVRRLAHPEHSAPSRQCTALACDRRRLAASKARSCADPCRSANNLDACGTGSGQTASPPATQRLVDSLAGRSRAGSFGPSCRVGILARASAFSAGALGRWLGERGSFDVWKSYSSGSSVSCPTALATAVCRLLLPPSPARHWND